MAVQVYTRLVFQHSVTRYSLDELTIGTEAKSRKGTNNKNASGFRVLTAIEKEREKRAM